jgi:hypothetical protein
VLLKRVGKRGRGTAERSKAPGRREEPDKHERDEDVDDRCDPRIATFMSFAGLRASSAAVETASNPMNAKKMIAAPVNAPPQPCGVKGLKLAPEKYAAPTMRKMVSALSLMSTMTVLKLTASLTPRPSMKARTSTIKIAGMLMMPHTPVLGSHTEGGWVHS